jgi:hypothetical protein
VSTNAEERTCVSQLSDNVKEFMADGRLSDRVKIECYLLVALGIRKAGLIMVPAELPGMESIGPEIDNEYYWRVMGRRDPNRPLVEFLSTRLQDTVRRFGKKSLPYKLQLLREIFDRVVLTTPQYNAHLEWAHKLGLRYKTEEVRPTIREIWIYKDTDTGQEIDRLAGLRRGLRLEALRRPRANAPSYYRVFPEEASPEFVRGVGEVLGYPPSCLNKYVADRASLDTNVEMRAASQLDQHQKAGKPTFPEAYFVKDFFPCVPDCPEACEIGKKALEALRSLDAGVAAKYETVLNENVTMTLKYPEIIKAHAEGLSKRLSAYQEEMQKTQRESQ